jgi:hypothetical protein
MGRQQKAGRENARRRRGNEQSLPQPVTQFQPMKYEEASVILMLR